MLGEREKKMSDIIKMQDGEYVKVIRCKDCKYYSDDYNDISGTCSYEIMRKIRGPMDYCSKGQKK